ncbi:nitrilase family protein [Robiginitalea sp. M366]|uniref:nitrilase family protein n=1 Tax=Robiginitalea aestuariiviva TaxID=3036903 RepID=UPI00240D1185|nr:nitrilase family protein [Robiginitalea aestuariiviva]MDG1571679.1 nitrilase family protein [Robiginitalea aestuariiviva]
MTLDVALVQSELSWEAPEANRRHFDGLLQPLGQGPDLIVLPEMFTSGFTMQPGNLDANAGPRTLDWMAEWARKADAAVAGSLVWAEGGTHTNRMVFMLPDGSYHSYDKRHTFTLAGEDKAYARGNRQVLVPFRGFVFHLQICYDLRFPVWSRNTMDYDALLYVANWPVPRIGAWDALLKARAIENMAYALGVNRTGTDPKHQYCGHSAAYDALGGQLAFLEQDSGVLRVELSREHLDQTRSQLRFLADRDAFTPGW